MHAVYGITENHPYAVTLRVIDLPVFQRRTLWTPDGADVIGTQVRIGLTAAYAPGGTPSLNSVTALSKATSLRLSPGSAGVSTDPTADTLRDDPRGKDPGEVAPFGAAAPMEPEGGVRIREQFSGPETDAELYTRLMTPRGKLILFAWEADRDEKGEGTGGKLIRWFESPRPGMSVDAANGPRPIACDVVALAGEPNSIGVYWEVETVLPPCPVGSDRLVLAHRWQMSHGHDVDNYLTRVVQGEITFHSGVRDLLGISPDAVRNQFIHPVPVGFRRGVPEVTQSSDGLTIRYTITDTCPTVVFGAGDSGASRAELVERVTLINPGIVG